MMARHHAAGEEMLRDPVLAIGAIEQIGAGAMGEDVQEEAAVRASAMRARDIIRASSVRARTSRPRRCGRTLPSDRTCHACGGSGKNGAGARLVVAIAIAARAQHLRFQRRDAGDVDQDPVHEDRRQQRRQTPRIAKADRRSTCRSRDRPASRTIRRNNWDGATSARVRHRNPAVVGADRLRNASSCASASASPAMPTSRISAPR